MKHQLKKELRYILNIKSTDIFNNNPHKESWLKKLRDFLFD